LNDYLVLDQHKNVEFIIQNSENIQNTFSFWSLHFTFWIQNMDVSGAYKWGGYIQNLSPQEIKKMKKNMKKVPIIQSKSDRYHLKEEQEAEQLLSKINNNKK